MLVTVTHQYYRAYPATRIYCRKEFWVEVEKEIKVSVHMTPVREEWGIDWNMAGREVVGLEWSQLTADEKREIEWELIGSAHDARDADLEEQEDGQSMRIMEELREY